MGFGVSGYTALRARGWGTATETSARLASGLADFHEAVQHQSLHVFRYVGVGHDDVVSRTIHVPNNHVLLRIRTVIYVSYFIATLNSNRVLARSTHSLAQGEAAGPYCAHLWLWGFVTPRTLSEIRQFAAPRIGQTMLEFANLPGRFKSQKIPSSTPKPGGKTPEGAATKPSTKTDIAPFPKQWQVHKRPHGPPPKWGRALEPLNEQLPIPTSVNPLQTKNHEAPRSRAKTLSKCEKTI